jgi:hypothetical protein
VTVFVFVDVFIVSYVCLTAERLAQSVASKDGMKVSHKLEIFAKLTSVFAYIKINIDQKNFP